MYRCSFGSVQISLCAEQLRHQDRAARRALKAEARMTGGLCEMAVLSLAAAKALHDELEAVYRPVVDFTGLTDAANREIARLGLA